MRWRFLVTGRNARTGHAMIARAAMAAKIAESPGDYKVCHGCGSIITRRSAECPNCRAYLFDLDEATVIAQAKLLATREAQSVAPEDIG